MSFLGCFVFAVQKHYLFFANDPLVLLCLPFIASQHIISAVVQSFNAFQTQWWIRSLSQILNLEKVDQISVSDQKPGPNQQPDLQNIRTLNIRAPNTVRIGFGSPNNPRSLII